MDRLLAGLAERGERVVELQTALTACKALGPDNGGRGELAKVRRITDWLAACGVRDLRRVDAPDSRVPDGLRPNLIARLPGAASRTLWLFGHTDVVPPAIPPPGPPTPGRSGAKATGSTGAAWRTISRPLSACCCWPKSCGGRT